MGNPDGGMWITNEQQLKHAQRRDPRISNRVLRDSRDQGLLPHAVRIGQQGKTPIYGFPADTLHQLDALLFWRAHTTNADWLRVLMWVDGWPIELSRARTSLLAILTKLVDEISSATAQVINDNQRPTPDDHAPGMAVAVRALAKALAARRGDNAVLPRMRGISATQRARTIELLLGPFLGVATDPTDEEVKVSLRLLGVDPRKSGRLGLPGFHPTDPAAFRDFGQFLSLDRLLGTVTACSDEDLCAVRDGANVIAVQLPIFAALVAAGLSEGSGSPIELVRFAHDKMIIYPLAVAVCLGLARAGMICRVQDVGRALARHADLPERVAEVASMPAKQVEANMGDDRKGLATVRRLAMETPHEELAKTQQRQSPHSR